MNCRDSLIFKAGAVLVAVLLSAHGTAWAGKKNDTLMWLTELEPPTYDYYAQSPAYVTEPVRVGARS